MSQFAAFITVSQTSSEQIESRRLLKRQQTWIEAEYLTQFDRMLLDTPASSISCHREQGARCYELNNTSKECSCSCQIYLWESILFSRYLRKEASCIFSVFTYGLFIQFGKSQTFSIIRSSFATAFLSLFQGVVWFVAGANPSGLRAKAECTMDQVASSSQGPNLSPIQKLLRSLLGSANLLEQ